MSIEQLESIAQAMVAPGKGIIAIDESNTTIKKRFDGVGIDCTEENRRAYREMLLTAPNLSDHISGAILYDETLRQSSRAGVPFTKIMLDHGILPGIKVDKGPHPLAGFPGELVTEGLDGLRDRLKEYADLGAKFAKWRAVITIGDDMPSSTCIEANCHALARYAALCQEAGIVPMVEPEVLMDGAHDLDVCYDVTEVTLRSLFASLYEQNVMLEGTILKASMVVSGKDCPEQASIDEVAEATVRCLKASVPASLPGIVFLSGGQSDEAATAHLNAMNQMGPHPWPLSFSYGRAMQSAALKLWSKDMTANFADAQKTVAQRARENGLAALGQWKKSA
ncbi:MAG: fructose-bisphosphate aldolase [Lysobacterales bacterium 69-70]|nr:fructose-bisphosphate aldolase class I [Xanthomonadaceae bacterium]ODU34332.1 MAG: fructose-bisphosphate aldolase [Xanthomonadaceae bacterium SCN 69-320]ODV22441.1 MAG: fructose-bisphosphate aldolase [Xanthomonadaceae bacterium SCN 69-25]OJY96238.1 MAG: fructose-bisphosphate aldolase [Xanthomonadales bacterium 69-70]